MWAPFSGRFFFLFFEKRILGFFHCFEGILGFPKTAKKILNGPTRFINVDHTMPRMFAGVG
jgi:hypothetical protein